MELKLPLGVVGRTDLNRLMRELNQLDDFFVTAAAKDPDSVPAAPHFTHLMEQLARDNSYNLLEAGVRKRLHEQLEIIKNQVPRLNISFAAEPSPQALERILVWFRTNIHPQALLDIGLQPTIAAGCILRTPNRIFDLSLRDSLKNQEPYLVKLIEGAARGNS